MKKKIMVRLLIEERFSEDRCNKHHIFVRINNDGSKTQIVLSKGSEIPHAIAQKILKQIGYDKKMGESK